MEKDGKEWRGMGRSGAERRQCGGVERMFEDWCGITRGREVCIGIERSGKESGNGGEQRGREGRKRSSEDCEGMQEDRRQ